MRNVIFKYAGTPALDPHKNLRQRFRKAIIAPPPHLLSQLRVILHDTTDNSEGHETDKTCLRNADRTVWKAQLDCRNLSAAIDFKPLLAQIEQRRNPRQSGTAIRLHFCMHLAPSLTSEVTNLHRHGWAFKV
jgi:hypothetical protein